MKKNRKKPIAVAVESVALVPAEIKHDESNPKKRERRLLENARTREAFEYYLSLGRDRTLQQVAEHFKISESILWAWSSTFKWAQRIRDLENRNISQMIEDTGLKVILMRIQGMFIPDPLDPKKVILDAKANVGAIKDLVASFVTLKKNSRERQEEEGSGGGGQNGPGKSKNQIMVNVIFET